jgi:Translation elongation factor EF-1alpha (GTPase)
VSGIDTDAICRGDVCGPVDDPPTVAETFQAELFVIDHPSVITAGYTPVFHTHTAQVACTIESIEEQIDIGSGETVAEDPDFIQSDDAATVTIRPQKPLCVEPFVEVPELGVFSARDFGQTVAAGVVVGIEPAEG